MNKAKSPEIYQPEEDKHDNSIETDIGVDMNADIEQAGKTPNEQAYLDLIPKYEDHHRELVSKLCNTKNIYGLATAGIVAEHIDKFVNIDYSATIDLIIEASETFRDFHPIYNLIESIEKFKGVNPTEIYNRIIDSNFFATLLSSQYDTQTEKFIDFSRLAEKLLKIIEEGYENSEYAHELLEKNFYEFKRLDSKLFLRLISINLKLATNVVEHLDNFENLDLKDAALKLLDADRVTLLFNNIDKFKGVLDKDFALKLLDDSRGPDLLFKNTYYFKGIIDEDVLIKLIDKGKQGTILKYSNILEEIINGPSELSSIVRRANFPLYLKELFQTKVENRELTYQDFLSIIELLDEDPDEKQFEKVLTDFPFLKDAVNENKHGILLLKSFSKFDDLSKNNIQKLYESKAVALEAQPGLDRSSAQFRADMQSSLINYESNESISKFAEENINTEQWLNYNQTINFKLEAEDDENERESEYDLNGHHVRLGLWSRDPDIDLYLGNYTDSDSRIDNDFYSSRSRISDYLSDLGMQVIKMTDMETNEPIVAAVCYIGSDEEGKIALVIDDIEANAKYSTQFKSQLEEKLKKYIEEYASACNINIISQGYNDDGLVAADLQEERFTKLWHNSPNGYFLKAEPKEDDDYVEDY